METDLPSTILEVNAAREKAKRDYRELDRRLFGHGTALAVAATGERFCKACGMWAEVRGQYRKPKQVCRDGVWQKIIDPNGVPLCLRCACLRVGVRVEVTNYRLDELPRGIIIDADNEAWIIDCDDGEQRRSLSAHLRTIEDDGAQGGLR